MVTAMLGLPLVGQMQSGGLCKENPITSGFYINDFYAAYFITSGFP
jgi:hypothetical protein